MNIPPKKPGSSRTHVVKIAKPFSRIEKDSGLLVWQSINRFGKNTQTTTHGRTPSEAIANAERHIQREILSNVEFVGIDLLIFLRPAVE